MVDVKWDLQGGTLDLGAAEKAVGRVLTFYRGALDGTICPVHQKEPWLRVKGSAVQNLAVSIEACCGELLQRAQNRVGEISRRDQE